MGRFHIEIKNDVEIYIEADSLNDCFNTITSAIKDVITDEKIESKKIEIFHLKDDFNEDLIVNFVNELIYLFDTKYFVARKVEVSEKKNGFEFKLYGDFLNDRNKINRLVKSATYHELNIERKENNIKFKVVVDI